MTIPDFQTLMRPVLASLMDGGVHRSRAVKDAMADQFELTNQERADMLPSGQQRTVDSRVAWALTYLVQAGLVERPTRGQVLITDEGRAALAAHPKRIDMLALEAYPSYLAFRQRTRQEATPAIVDAVPLEIVEATPSDLVEQAVSTNRAAVEGEVLKKALALSPTGFEDLVIRLLEAMDYGRAGSVERTRSSGDAGVDGIITQDPLGLDRIYVQAKRYAEDRIIDRPKIHEFAGALLGKQGDRGVHSTASTFSSGARQEAEWFNAGIELIDGARLSEVLVRCKSAFRPSGGHALRLNEDFSNPL